MKRVYLFTALLFFSVQLFSQTVSNVYQLTNDSTFTDHPAWSYDGNKIVFESGRSGVRSIWMLASNGLEINPKQITDDAAEDFKPDWRPYLNEITFSSNRYGEGDSDIWIIDTLNYALFRVTTDTAEEYSPAYAPDGSKIVFVSKINGEEDIWTKPTSCGSPAQITNNETIDLAPCFSPNGNAIAYYVHGETENCIWIIPASGGEAVMHINNASCPAWSPDGSQIAFNADWSGNFDIWTYNLSDSSFVQLTTDTADDFNSDYSPDGNKLAFVSTRSGKDNIWVAELKPANIAEDNFSENIKILPNPFFQEVKLNITLENSSRVYVYVMDINGKIKFRKSYF